ncbi:MAG: glycosyltransferase family 39 protein [Clostridiales bacterium]|nr:glycosyltransferase family 39 protein [Clostridiales bacterium]
MLFISANGASAASDVIIAVFLVILTLMSFVGLIVCICRFVKSDEGIKNPAVFFLIVFGVGFALRLVFALCIRGFRDDYAVFSRMFDHLNTDGISGYYAGDASVVLYPVVYFIYLIFGGISNAMGFSQYALGMQFMVKLPLIIADLLAAFAVYKIAAKYINKRVALSLCAFVCICPIFFIGSSLWCTPITFTVMFACLACYFLARKKHLWTIVFMTAAAFSSKEGIYLFPVACVFSLYHFVRAIRNILKNSPKGKALLGSDYIAAITVPVGFVASLVGAYLVGLFMISSYSYNLFTFIYEFLIAPLVGWSYFTFNGLSVYTIFNQNGSVPSARFPSWVFALVFIAIITAVVCIVYFSKRNRATLVMLAAYSLFTMQTYYPGSTAIGFACVFAVLLAAYALVRDKRLLMILFASGLAYVVNTITALSCAGYLNNLGEYYFGTEQQLLSGNLGIVGIICSVVTVLSHIYFTVVTVSVGMTGQKKLLEPQRGIMDSIKEFFAIKKGV